MRSFRRDTRGNIATMAALLMTATAGFAAFGIDLGKAFVDRRKAQGTADLAAIAAASDLPHAMEAARATVSRNGYAAGTPLVVELGTYTADPAVPPARRFVPGGAGPNAVRVVLATTTPLMFARLIGAGDGLAIRTSATAAGASTAAFAIGSRLAAVDGGLLNQVLGALLGGSLSLTAMDYRSLASANLDLFDVLNAAAARAQVAGPTYASLLDTTIGLGPFVLALSDAARAGGSTAAAQALASAAATIPANAPRLALGALVDAGPYAPLPLGQKPQASVSASALDLLSMAAQVANGRNEVALALGLDVPGVASVSAKLSIGELPAGSSWLAVGPAGATAHTAQTRLLLTVRLVGSGQASVVTVPLYVEVASGTATLSSVACDYADQTRSTATLAVSPGIVDAWIGAVSDADMTNFASAPNPPAATLVNLGALSISARAHAAVGNVAPTPVTFSFADVQAGRRQTVTSTGFTSSLTSSLLSDLSIGIGGVSLLGNALGPLVGSILADNTAALDQVLSRTLAALGIGLGQADVWVSDLRCGGGVLVN